MADEEKRRLRLTGNVPKKPPIKLTGDRTNVIKLTGKRPEKTISNANKLKITGAEVSKAQSIKRDETKVLEERCLYCQELIVEGDTYATCDNCGGHTHVECWEYVGRCSNNFHGCYL